MARDALIGFAFGILFFIADIIVSVSFLLGRAEPGPPGLFNLEAAAGIRFFVFVFSRSLLATVFVSLGMVALLFFLRILLRNQKATLVVYVLFGAFIFGPDSLWTFAEFLVLSAIITFVLMRFGLVAAVILVAYLTLLITFPTTLDTSAWYFPYGFATLAVLAAIVLYAFRFSLGGRPLLAASHLDD